MRIKACAVTIALILAAGCATDPKQKQLVALDAALKSGAITGAEYDAKRDAILGGKASASKAEVAHSEPVTASTPEGSNVPSQQTPAPVAAAPPMTPPAAPTQTAAPIQKAPEAQAASAPTGGASAGGFYRMKMVRVMDEHGFERPIPAMTLLLPVDWQLQGGVQYLQVGGCGLQVTTFRASGPDGRSIDMLPDYTWQWSDDAQTVHYLQMAKAQSGGKGCDVMPPVGAADLLRRVLIPKFGGGARLAGIEPVPEAAEKMREIAQQQQAQAQQAGMQVRVKSDVGRARLEAGNTDVWLTAAVLLSSMPRATFNTQTLRQGQAAFYTGWVRPFLLRTPKGQLDKSERFFQMVLSTIRVDPNWQARVTGVQNNIAAAQIKGAADRSKIIAKSSAETNAIITQGYNERSKIVDQSMQNYSQMQRGVETYRNPSTGDTFELSNQYGHAWVNNSNEYLLSDRPNFDPNVELKTGNWTELQRVKP